MVAKHNQFPASLQQIKNVAPTCTITIHTRKMCYSHNATQPKEVVELDLNKLSRQSALPTELVKQLSCMAGLNLTGQGKARQSIPKHKNVCVGHLHLTAGNLSLPVFSKRGSRALCLFKALHMPAFSNSFLSSHTSRHCVFVMEASNITWTKMTSEKASLN